MSYRSTMVLEIMRRFPWSVSFIALGAARQEGVKILRIDGWAPADHNYPYYQIFALITKGQPSEKVQKFIDFVYSPEGKQIIVDRGMVPLPKVRE